MDEAPSVAAEFDEFEQHAADVQLGLEFVDRVGDLVEDVDHAAVASGDGVALCGEKFLVAAQVLFDELVRIIGPAPYRPFHHAYHPWIWRSWWDYGSGTVGEMTCHALHVFYKALHLDTPSMVHAQPLQRLHRSTPHDGRT